MARQLSRKEMQTLKGGLLPGGVDCSVNCGNFIMKVTCSSGSTCDRVDGQYARCTKGKETTQMNCPASLV